MQRRNLHKRLQEQVEHPKADLVVEAEQHRTALQTVPVEEVPLEVPLVS